MSSLLLDSEPMLMVVRQLALALFTIFWIMQRPKHRLARYGLHEKKKKKDLKKTANIRTGRRKSVGLQRPVLLV